MWRRSVRLEGRSYPFVDLPCGHVADMQMRLEQRGWRIRDRLPDADVEFPPVPPGFCRRHGVDWVGASTLLDD